MTVIDQSAPIAVGMIVTADDPRTPGLYRVESKGPKNYGIVPVNADGTRRAGRGARFPGYMLAAADPAAAAAPPAVGIPYVPVAALDPGTIVRFAKDGNLYVVIADKIDKVNIASLGGNNDGRYWRAPRTALTVVPLGELAAAL